MVIQEGSTMNAANKQMILQQGTISYCQKWQFKNVPLNSGRNNNRIGLYYMAFIYCNNSIRVISPEVRVTSDAFELDATHLDLHLLLPLMILPHIEYTFSYI